MERSDLHELYRESAWRHFSIHAEQRLRMLQFYITVSTARLGGGVLLLRTDNEIAIILIGSLASFFSFVFWKLEARTRTLVKNAEDAIKHLDESINLPDVDGEPSPLKLFTIDDYRTRRPNRLAPTRFTYHTCFVLVFAVVACLGLLGKV